MNTIRIEKKSNNIRNAKDHKRLLWIICQHIIEEVDNFLKTYNLPRLNHEEIKKIWIDCLLERRLK